MGPDGGALGPGGRLREWPFALVVVTALVGLFVVAQLDRFRRGSVVFVNSGAGLRANPQWSAYAASKHGLRALADSLRAEEAAAGVRVSTVFPSRTATPMQERVHAQEGREYDAADWIRPETVADAIVRLVDLPRDATITDVTVRPAG